MTTYALVNGTMTEVIRGAALTDALASSLVAFLEVDPCEHITWGMNDSPRQLAACVLGDVDFREALTKALTDAIVDLEEDRLNPLCLCDQCDHPDGECPEPTIGCEDGAALAGYMLP